MKSRLILVCIFSSVALISPMLGSSLEKASSQQEFSFTSLLEIQECSREIAQNGYRMIEKILPIPSDQQTFENTLRPWNQLKEDLTSSLKQLNEFAERASLSVNAIQTMQDLREFLMEISQDGGLHEALIGCCQKINHNPISTPIECYIANQFLSDNRCEFAHLRGAVQEKYTNEIEFTILNLKSADLLIGQALDLAKKISLKNADVVCIHEISANTAHDLFHALQDDYAHFLYLDADSAVFDFLEYQKGTLIISKSKIEKAQFNRIAASSTDLNQSFFDFIIKNGEESLGHFYVTHFKGGQCKEREMNRFVKLIGRMQEDILKMDEGLIPFFLCGDLRSLQSTEEGKRFIDTYFPI